MAIVRIPDKNQTLHDVESITECLHDSGIDYEYWGFKDNLPPFASSPDILTAYSSEIETLKARGGYVTADVVQLTPQTPGLEAMLAKFNVEHWHDEDEVRFIVQGHGVFHIRPTRGPVVAIQMEAGDLIRVPVGTKHWFDLCADRQIRAIRLFQDPNGWTPYYTESKLEQSFEPVCLGPTYFPVLGNK